MSKPIILTGIRANNDLTIGNYFGGILPIIDMAKKQSEQYQINMFIPDLHSFTTKSSITPGYLWQPDYLLITTVFICIAKAIFLHTASSPGFLSVLLVLVKWVE